MSKLSGTRDVVYKLVDEVESKIEDLESKRDYYIECYHEEIGC